MKTKAERILCIAPALCICLTILPNVTRQVAAADPINMMIAYAQDRLGKTGSQLGYGNEPWCAYFVSDCAAYAGQSGAIPKHGNAHSLYFLVRDAGGTPVSSPQAGDLIFYNCPASDTTGDGISIMHVGLVAYDGYTIEGNRSGEVKKQKLTDSFRDEHGHSTTTGAVTRLYLRPAYSGQTPHTHSYTGARVYENAHPHRFSQRCVDYASCGGWIWTDEYKELKTCEQCWHADFYIGASSISVEVGESKTVSASLSGCLPDTAVAYPSFSPDNDVVEVTIKNQQATFTGLKEGTTLFQIRVYSDSSKSYLIGATLIRVDVATRTYTVVCNANGGSGVLSTQTVNAGAALGTMPVPTRDGFDFAGWYETIDGNYNPITSETVIEKDMTLYAHWMNRNYRGNKVNFEASGGLFEGKQAAHSLNGFNISREQAYLLIYNCGGQWIDTNEWGVEFLVNSDGSVVGRREYGNVNRVTVPEAGFVVSGHIWGGRFDCYCLFRRYFDWYICWIRQRTGNGVFLLYPRTLFSKSQIC